MAIIYTQKKLGETPLECLERVRIEQNISMDESVTFAGRLDPAATGEMLLLSGDDVHKKDEYTHFNKEYQVEYVLGVATDTGDLLGVIQNTNLEFDESKITTTVLGKVFAELSGTRQQKFHSFSSKIVDGKPLWLHTKEGNSKEADHAITIHSIQILDISQITVSDIVDRALLVTQLVEGDFRQDEILKSWENFAAGYMPGHKLLKIMVSVVCSSGTYMRVLGEELSQKISMPVVAYSIHRRKIFA